MKAKVAPRRFLFSQEELDEYKKQIRARAFDECIEEADEEYAVCERLGDIERASAIGVLRACLRMRKLNPLAVIVIGNEKSS